MVLTAPQASSIADLKALNAPVSENELMKLLTDLVAIVKPLDIPLTMSPTPVPNPWNIPLKSMAFSAALAWVETYLNAFAKPLMAPVLLKPFQND